MKEKSLKRGERRGGGGDFEKAESIKGTEGKFKSNIKMIKC